MFDSLYECRANGMKKALGDNFCGPDRLPHGQEVLVAVFEDNPKSDGHRVEMYCTALPAMFYKIKALDSKNSVGDEQKGFCLETGSGVFEWAVTTAKMINEGMLGCST